MSNYFDIDECEDIGYYVKSPVDKKWFKTLSEAKKYLAGRKENNIAKLKQARLILLENNNRFTECPLCDFKYIAFSREALRECPNCCEEINLHLLED